MLLYQFTGKCDIVLLFPRLEWNILLFEMINNRSKMQSPEPTGNLLLVVPTSERMIMEILTRIFFFTEIVNASTQGLLLGFKELKILYLGMNSSSP